MLRARATKLKKRNYTDQQSGAHKTKPLMPRHTTKPRADLTPRNRVLNPACPLAYSFQLSFGTARQSLRNSADGTAQQECRMRWPGAGILTLEDQEDLDCIQYVLWSCWTIFFGSLSDRLICIRTRFYVTEISTAGGKLPVAVAAQISPGFFILLSSRHACRGSRPHFHRIMDRCFISSQPQFQLERHSQCSFLRPLFTPVVAVAPMAESGESDSNPTPSSPWSSHSDWTP